MHALKRGFSGRKSGGANLDAQDLLNLTTTLAQDEKEWRDALARDARLVQSAESFCTEFLTAVTAMSTAVNKFWEELQDLDAAGLDVADDTAVVTHMWALRTGLQAVTPAATRALKRSINRLKEMGNKNRKWSEVCTAKDARWKEKVHYDAKLGELLKIKTQREDCGKSLSSEQAAHLTRNLSKHEAACEKYAQMNDAVQSAMRKQRQETQQDKEANGLPNSTSASTFSGDVELRRLLRDLLRSVSCGWFVSSGATVCQAINQAEGDAGAGQADFRSSSSFVPQRPVRGMLMLPKSMEQFEPSSDPAMAETRRASSVTVEEVVEEVDDFAFMEGMQDTFETDSDAGDDAWSPEPTQDARDLSGVDNTLGLNGRSASGAVSSAAPSSPVGTGIKEQEESVKASKHIAVVTQEGRAPRTDSTESAGSFWSFVDAGAFGPDMVVHNDDVSGKLTPSEELSTSDLRLQLKGLGYDVPSDAGEAGSSMDRDELLRIVQAVQDS